MSETYNIHHILTQCLLLKPYRKQDVSVIYSHPVENYVQIFTNLSFVQLKEINNLLNVHASQLELTM